MAFPVLSDVAPAAVAWRTSVEAAVRSTAALATGRSTTPRCTAAPWRCSGRTAVRVSVKLGFVAALIAIGTAGLGSRELKGPAKPQPPAPLAARPAIKPAAAV